MEQENKAAMIQIFCVINAAVYFAALLFLGATTWRAAVLAIAILAASCMGVGRTVLLRGGAVILLLFLLAWAGVTPHAVAQLAAG